MSAERGPSGTGGTATGTRPDLRGYSLSVTVLREIAKGELWTGDMAELAAAVLADEEDAANG